MQWCAVVLVAMLAQFGQADVGELRITAIDQTGGVLRGAMVAVDSDASQTHREFVTDPSGVAIVARLPFGVYRITVSLTGFETTRSTVHVRTAAPSEQRLTLPLAGPMITIEEPAVP